MVMPTKSVRPYPRPARVVLHSRDCRCGGSGWISYPGIGRRAYACPSQNTRVIAYDEWVRLGRPLTIEAIPEEER